MKVSKDKVVTLTYELRRKDEQGEMIQKVDEKRPVFKRWWLFNSKLF